MLHLEGWRRILQAPSQRSRPSVSTHQPLSEKRKQACWLRWNLLKETQNQGVVSQRGTLRLRRSLARERAKVMLISENEPKPVGERCDSTESKLYHLVFIFKKPSRLPENSLLLPRFRKFLSFGGHVPWTASN